jgi:hypothetical protein
MYIHIHLCAGVHKHTHTYIHTHTHTHETSSHMYRCACKYAHLQKRTRAQTRPVRAFCIERPMDGVEKGRFKGPAGKRGGAREKEKGER